MAHSWLSVTSATSGSGRSPPMSSIPPPAIIPDAFIAWYLLEEGYGGKRLLEIRTWDLELLPSYLSFASGLKKRSRFLTRFSQRHETRRGLTGLAVAAHGGA